MHTLLYHTPYTLPYTLYPILYTLYPIPYTIYSTIYQPYVPYCTIPYRTVPCAIPYNDLDIHVKVYTCLPSLDFAARCWPAHWRNTIIFCLLLSNSLKFWNKLYVQMISAWPCLGSEPCSSRNACRQLHRPQHWDARFELQCCWHGWRKRNVPLPHWQDIALALHTWDTYMG